MCCYCYSKSQFNSVDTYLTNMGYISSEDVRIAALEAKLEQTAQLNMMETEKGDSKHIATSDYPLARVS